MPKSSQHHSSSRSKTRSAAADPPGSSSASRSSNLQHARSQAGPALPTPSAANAKDHIDAIHERTNQTDNEELAIKRKLVPRLAKRAYHLEDDNTWCQDWIQYQRNTHPVFGLCLYHRFHPIRLPQRVIILVGSIGESVSVLCSVGCSSACMGFSFTEHVHLFHSQPNFLLLQIM